MLNISHVTKSYTKSGINAVDDLTLNIGSGEIFGFIGSNGAGKTTTIKMMTGILQADSGSITISGCDIKNNPIETKRKFGYVSDTHDIYLNLTGREYVNFLSDIYGVNKKDRQTRADELLERFSLTKAFDARISTYSHGMKQKIAIIGALIHDPDLLILDEPMVGLDPQSAFELKEIMRGRCAAGKTVFFSTHVLEVAEKLCTRIGVINNGRLIASGSMEEIMALSKDASLEEYYLKISGKLPSDNESATTPVDTDSKAETDTSNTGEEQK